MMLFGSWSRIHGQFLFQTLFKDLQEMMLVHVLLLMLVSVSLNLIWKYYFFMLKQKYVKLYKFELILLLILLSKRSMRSEKSHVCESNCDHGARSTNGQNLIDIRDQDELGPRVSDLDCSPLTGLSSVKKKDSSLNMKIGENNQFPASKYQLLRIKMINIKFFLYKISLLWNGKVLTAVD